MVEYHRLVSEADMSRCISLVHAALIYKVLSRRPDERQTGSIRLRLRLLHLFHLRDAYSIFEASHEPVCLLC